MLKYSNTLQKCCMLSLMKTRGLSFSNACVKVKFLHFILTQRRLFCKHPTITLNVSSAAYGSSAQKTTEPMRSLGAENLPFKEKQALLDERLSLNTEDFISKLQSYKQLNTKVVPKLFMNEVKAAGLDPSEEMLKLLLEVVAECGDIGYVSSVVTSMKSRNYQADDGVFGSLIIAHAVRGDIASAREVLSTMEECRVEPGSKTYTALMRASAMMGDYAALHTYRVKCVEKGINLSSKQILEILETVVKTGREHLLPSLRSSLETCSSEELSQLASDLLYAGHANAGYSVLKLLDKSKVEGVCQQFVQNMLNCKIGVAPMLAVGERMVADNSYGRALYDITKHFMISQQVAWALTALRSCRKNNLTVRAHFFWPLFLAVARVNGEKGIYEILEEMKEMGIPPDVETFDFILPHLTLDDSEGVLRRIKEASGVSLAVLLSPYLAHLTRNSSLTQALLLAKKHKSTLDKDLDPLLAALAANYRSTKEPRMVCEMLQLLGVRHIADWLISLFSSSSWISPHDVIALTKELKKIGSFITLSDERYILRTLNRSKNNSPPVTEALSHLVTDEVILPTSKGQSSSDVEDLECHLGELEAKGMNTRGVLRKLLQMYCRNGDVNGARSVYKKLLSIGSEISPGMVSSMMHVNIQAKQLDDALEFYRRLDEDFPSFQLDSYKIVDLATLLVKSNRFQDSLKLLSSNTQRHITEKSFENWERNCWELLNASVELQGLEGGTLMLHTLMDNNICLPTSVILGTIIRAHLVSNDLEGACNKFIQYAKDYKKTPLQQEIISAILSRKEDLLEGILSAAQNVHGLESTQAALIAAIAIDGDLDRLKRVIQAISVVNTPQMRKHIERMTGLGQVEALKTLLEVCGKTELADSIISSILSHYHRTGDADSALKWWSSLEDTGARPSSEHRTSLSNLVASSSKL